MENNFSVLIQAILDSSKLGKSDIEKVQKVIDKYHVNLTTDLDKANTIAEIKKIVPEIEKVLKDVTGIDIKINDKDLIRAFNQVEKEASKAAREEQKLTDAMEKARVKSEQLRQAEEKRQQVSQNKSLEQELALRQKIAKQSGNIKTSVGENGNITTTISILSNNFTKLGLSADEVKTKMKSVETEYSALKSLISSGSSDNEIVAQFTKLNTAMVQTQNELKQTRSEYSLLISDQRRLSLANTIEEWNQKNTKATKEARANNESYIASLRDLNSQMTKMKFSEIETGFKNTENSMRGLGRLGASFKDQMIQAADSFKTWLSVSSGIMFIISEFKNAISEIKELDNILTEIGKTSDRTLDQLQSLGKESYSHASKYGRTASDWLTGVQEMNRSGFQGQQGNDMADLSILAQTAGDLNRDTADSYILAMNAAYGYEGSVEKLNAALDGMNQITNVNSTDMNTMANAISKAGSTASTFDVQVNELSAMIGTISARTKESGEEVGTGIKSLLINLQNTSSDKIVQTLKKANVSMTEMKNGIEQLRSPIAILEDLQKVFNSLDSKDPLKAEILTNIGQKYHANVCVVV